MARFSISHEPRSESAALPLQTVERVAVDQVSPALAHFQGRSDFLFLDQLCEKPKNGRESALVTQLKYARRTQCPRQIS